MARRKRNRSQTKIRATPDLHQQIVRHCLLAGSDVVEIGMDVAGMGIAALAALRPVVGQRALMVIGDPDLFAGRGDP